MRPFFILPFLLTQALTVLPAQDTAAEFAAKAYATLPVEDSYTFHQQLSEWREPLRRDPAAKPATSELAIPPQGWRLLIRADSGQVLQTAAAEFQEYLDRSMQVRVALERPAQLADWQTQRTAIVAGTRDQIARLRPGALKGPRTTASRGCRSHRGLRI